MYRSRPMIGRAGEEEYWTCMLRCVYTCIRILSPSRCFDMVMFGVFFLVSVMLLMLLMLLMLIMFSVTRKHEQVQLRKR